MKPICRSRYYNWNRNYAYTDYGQPTALVVPPTAQLQTNWGWGVASSRISPIDHQFARNYPGNGPFGGPYRPTPLWPSDTTEFGVYPVRPPGNTPPQTRIAPLLRNPADSQPPAMPGVFF